MEPHSRSKSTYAASVGPSQSSHLLLLPTPSKITSSQRLSPSLLVLLLLNLLQLARIHLTALNAVHSFFAAHIANSAEEAAAGELPAHSLRDSALDSSNILVVSDRILLQRIYDREGLSASKRMAEQ